MKNRRKRKQTQNRVMSIRVLLSPDPHWTTCVLKRAEPIDIEELYLAKGDATRVGHLRAVTSFCTEQMGVDITQTHIVMERGFCIHPACPITPLISIDCKTDMDWEGSFIQKIGNTHPMQRLIEIHPPANITPPLYRKVVACPTYRKLKVLTKDQTIRLVSSIVAVTLPYYALPQDSSRHKTFGKPFTSAPVEWLGDKRWHAEYDLFLLENFAEGNRGRNHNTNHTGETQ